MIQWSLYLKNGNYKSFSKSKYGKRYKQVTQSDVSLMTNMRKLITAGAMKTTPKSTKPDNMTQNWQWRLRHVSSETKGSQGALQLWVWWIWGHKMHNKAFVQELKVAFLVSKESIGPFPRPLITFFLNGCFD